MMSELAEGKQNAPKNTPAHRYCKLSNKRVQSEPDILAD